MAVLNVPNEYSTIQSAVNTAQNGDIIKVCPGIYKESVKIDAIKNRIKIISACSCKNCILTGTSFNHSCQNNSLDTGFIINSNQVTISGFTIKNFKFNGIEISGNQNIISNCSCLKNGSNGIYIGNNGNKNLCLNTNCCYNCNDGFFIESNSNYIIKCTADNNADKGIELDADNNCVLQSKCYCNKNDGVKVDGNQCNILANTCCNNFIGIGINSNGNLIYNNIMINNYNSGICIYIPELEIDNNHSYCTNNSYKENTILLNCIKSNCNDGMKIESCNQCNILYNCITCNGKNGFDLQKGSCNIIDNCNLLYNCSAGIKLNDCVDNAIRNNSICCNCPNIKLLKNASENNILDDNCFC